MAFLADHAGYIGIGLLFLFMILGVPVFVAMALSATFASLLVSDPSQIARTFIQATWQSASIFEFVALPLFILTGTIMQGTDAGQGPVRGHQSVAWFGPEFARCGDDRGMRSVRGYQRLERGNGRYGRPGGDPFAARGSLTASSARPVSLQEAGRSGSSSRRRSRSSSMGS